VRVRFYPDGAKKETRVEITKYYDDRIGRL
jgi:hypothetical protein